CAHVIHAGRIAGDGRAGMESRRRVRSLRKESQQRCIATENRGQDRQLDRGRRSQRIADPRFSEETRDLDSARLGSALHVAADSGISALTRLTRYRRFYLALSLERALHSLSTGVFGDSQLLLSPDRDGSAARLCA